MTIDANTIIYSLLVFWHTFIGSQILCFWNKSTNNLCKESTSGKWLWMRCNTYISSISPYWLFVLIFPLHSDNTHPFLVRKNTLFVSDTKWLISWNFRTRNWFSQVYRIQITKAGCNFKCKLWQNASES